MSLAIGNASCPCINVTSNLLGPEVVAKSGYRPPVGYGSSECRDWDALRDECSAASPPSWCSLNWCYVDRDVCMGSSMYVRRSIEFPASDNLYYSWETCADTLGTLNKEDEIYQKYLSKSENDGRLVRVGIPECWHPYHFKRDSTGAVYEGKGAIYTNPAIPWEGIIPNYLNAMLPYTSWRNVTFVTVSGGAQRYFPGSMWTAAVQDVSSHLVVRTGRIKPSPHACWLFAASSYWQLLLTVKQIEPAAGFWGKQLLGDARTIRYDRLCVTHWRRTNLSLGEKAASCPVDVLGGLRQGWIAAFKPRAGIDQVGVNICSRVGHRARDPHACCAHTLRTSSLISDAYPRIAGHLPIYCGSVAGNWPCPARHFDPRDLAATR